MHTWVHPQTELGDISLARLSQHNISPVIRDLGGRWEGEIRQSPGRLEYKKDRNVR